MRSRRDLLALAGSAAMVLACNGPKRGGRGGRSAGAEPQERTLAFGGKNRTFFVQPAGGAAPTVMAIHGHKSGPEVMFRTHDWAKTAAEQGWTGIYPSTGEGESTDPEGGDHAFLAQLLTQAADQGQADPSRCWVVGFSGGAYKAYQLASQESRTVAGIVACSGKMGDLDTGYDGYDPRVTRANPVSILHVHGGQDTTVPLGGGPYGEGAKRRTALGVQQGLDLWIAHLGMKPTNGPPLPGVPARCRVNQWVADSGHRIALIVDPDLGHTYPEPWLNETAVAFFQATPPRR